MKKNLYIFLSVWFVFFLGSCKQDNGGGQSILDGDNGGKAEPELIFRVGEQISFKMRRIEAVRKTTLGKLTGSERVVSLSPYYVAETEVTQELFEAVMGYNPSAFKKDPVQGEVQEKRPVEQVTWYDTVAFCNNLTEVINGNVGECVYTLTNIKKRGNNIISADVKVDVKKKGFRLPTEAEFEYAAKGGVEDIIYAGADHDDEKAALKKVAWFSENSGDRTHEVAKKKANGYGLFDMSGNVFEWCQDNYTRIILTNVELDPQGPRKPTGGHVTKGGGYGEGGYSFCSVGARTGNVSDFLKSDTGFRIVVRR